MIFFQHTLIPLFALLVAWKIHSSWISTDVEISLSFSELHKQRTFVILYDSNQIFMTSSCDSLTIHDGVSNASPMFGNPHCGDTLPQSNISSSNHLLILFHSDHLYTGTGFKLEYSATSKNPYKVFSCRKENDILIRLIQKMW